MAKSNYNCNTHKKGPKSAPENYRHISLTSVMSKIMVSIVIDAILTHLVKNNLLTDEEHGFVPSRNCITQLLLCLEDWTAFLLKSQTRPRSMHSRTVSLNTGMIKAMKLEHGNNHTILESPHLQALPLFLWKYIILLSLSVCFRCR